MVRGRIFSAPIETCCITDMIDMTILAVTVDGARTGKMWVGSYLRFSGLRPGDRITVSYPMAERDETVQVMEDEYTVHWKGNTVTRISPEAEIGPLYRRAAMEKGEAPLVRYPYHSPNQEIRW